MRKQTLRTGVSAAYWCDPAEGYPFTEAYLPAMTRGRAPTAWLDELFEGGLSIPAKGENASMTLLVTGAPGTGKSTLCLELCYRLALGAPANPPDFEAQNPLRSLYITTEGHEQWVIDHAREFGWDKNGRVFGTDIASSVLVKSLKTERDFIDLISMVQPADLPGEAPAHGLRQLFESLYTTYFGRRPVAAGVGHDHPAVPRHLPRNDGPQERPPAWTNNIPLEKIDILVFDNLNTLKVDKGLWFQMLSDFAGKGPRLVVVVLDAHESSSAEEWAYLADAVIRMGRETGSYLIRTIEILKSRYQLSALGRHQVKINKAFPLESDRGAKEMRMRHHPFREEGGIFIYPSMHFVLSRHKYLRPTPDSKPIEPLFPELTSLLAGGFHEGRCIALSGPPGTHKSRLAFAQMLHTLRHHDGRARAIVITLGDDEATTERVLREIDREQFGGSGGDVVKTLIDSGRLEIAYYPPGFITPDEFFHRLQLSIGRNRRYDTHAPLIVIFNSLNLLHSHFPLCAEHKVFIPAMVELLGHEGVTSFFVTAAGAANDEYGLLSLADPILEFTRSSIDTKWAIDRLLSGKVGRRLRKGWPDKITLVEMKVGRFAGGTSAGASAFLTLARSSSAAVQDPMKDMFGPGLRFWIPK